MTTVLAMPEPGEWLVVCKGAPEVVFGTPGLLDDDRVDQARAVAAGVSERGYRVLAVAHRRVSRPLPAKRPSSDCDWPGWSPSSTRRAPTRLTWWNASVRQALTYC
jgi:magnesium-transporting ATPase (P-type)